jgi:hypothetical protein
MSTAPVVPHHNGFVRFIDAIGHDLSVVGHVIQKDAPIVEGLAVAAEPILVFSPFGPEYALVVNAIVGVQKTAEASLAAGVNLTGTQKMGIVLNSVTPGLNAILSSKGVTSDTETHIANWTQLVFNLLSGPAVSALVAAAKGTAAIPVSVAPVQ